jgi:hypothetical protein
MCSCRLPSTDLQDIPCCVIFLSIFIFHLGYLEESCKIAAAMAMKETCKIFCVLLISIYFIFNVFGLPGRELRDCRRHSRSPVPYLWE